MTRSARPFRSQTWIENVVRRAQSYGASMLVVTADTTSTPGALGRPKAYLVVGSNDFLLALPHGFDIDELLAHVSDSIGARFDTRSARPHGVTGQYSCAMRGGPVRLRTEIRRRASGLEIAMQLPLGHRSS